MPFVHICQRATELWDVVLSVEYEGVCETECLALLRRAKQRSDLQEAVLRARLSNEEVKDGQPTLGWWRINVTNTSVFVVAEGRWNVFSFLPLQEGYP